MDQPFYFPDMAPRNIFCFQNSKEPLKEYDLMM